MFSPSSSSASLHASSPNLSRSGSTATLQTLNSVERPPTRTGRLTALARLRIPTASPRRRKNESPMERTRKEYTMSIYSDATTIDQLPTPASEVTLARSFGSSEKLYDANEHRGLARSLVHRSSRMFLRKKSSKTSLMSSAATDYTGTDSRRCSTESTQRPSSKHSRAHSRPRCQPDAAPSKPRISQPFNFQHVAHTAPVQAISALRQVSPSALETEFTAMQAGQTPSNELKHIDTEALRPSTAADDTASPTGPRDSPALRNARSADNFKRQSKSFSQPFFQGPPIPPPRKSSRKKRPPHLAHLPALWPAVQESPTIPDFMLSNSRPRTAPSQRSALRIATSAASTPLGLTGIAHAVTTPDDTACVLGPEVIPPLEDVPEEADSSATVYTPTKDPAATAAAAAAVAAAAIAASNSAEPQTRMLRSGSDPVLPENAAEDAEEIPSRTSRRVSGKLQPAQSWDDCIDYCYDHALEAGGEATSPDVDTPVSDVEEMVFMKGHRRQGSRASRMSIDSVSAAPTTLHQRRPSANGQFQSKTLRVPSMLDAPVDSAGNIMFTLSPSMVIPREYSVDDAYYDQQYSRQASPKSSRSSQMQMFTPSISDLSRAYSSPRSSVTFSNSSKRTSTMAGESSTSLSAASIPDLEPCHVGQQNRKSFGARSVPSLTQVQDASPNEGRQTPTTPTQELVQQQQQQQQAVSSPKKAEPVASSAVAIDDAASETPVPKQPLRARAKSESASRALAQGGTAAKAAAHSRSVSSAATMPKKPTYSLFPPLDRIGATHARV